MLTKRVFIIIFEACFCYTIFKKLNTYLLSALDIVQDEQYLEDSDFDEIRLLKRNGRAAIEIKEPISTNTSDTKNLSKGISDQEVLKGKRLLVRKFAITSSQPIITS